jgi:hypothetical protein
MLSGGCPYLLKEVLFGQAEVPQLDMQLVVSEDIPRLDIAMQDAFTNNHWIRAMYAIVITVNMKNTGTNYTKKNVLKRWMTFHEGYNLFLELRCPSWSTKKKCPDPNSD